MGDADDEVRAQLAQLMLRAEGAAAEHRVTGPSGRDHRARRPITRIGALVGAAAALVAIGLGTAMLLRTPASAPTASPTAQQITVTPSASIPLSAPQVIALAQQRPDYGALADPQRRASCLAGLGYPASVPILGAQPLQVGDQPGVLLVLAGDNPGDLAALLVQPNCSSADTGLIADTSIRRP